MVLPTVMEKISSGDAVLHFWIIMAINDACSLHESE